MVVDELCRTSLPFFFDHKRSGPLYSDSHPSQCSFCDVYQTPSSSQIPRATSVRAYAAVIGNVTRSFSIFRESTLGFISVMRRHPRRGPDKDAAFVR
jgi:hypothetical protein